MKEQEVTIQGKVNLSGTLAVPENSKEKHPAILIIGGTGTGDRDGNIAKKNLVLNMYKNLAEYLTSLGWITLRYDKRGVGKSEGDYIRTGMVDLIDDAEAAVRFLSTHPAVDAEKIFVLGHSEGSALTVALNARMPLAGLLLLSGAFEKMETAMRKQRQFAYDELNKMKGLKGKLIRLLNLVEKQEIKAQKFLDRVMASTEDMIKVQLFFPVNAKWMRETFAYDIEEDLKKIQSPTLIVTGDIDFQVDPQGALYAQQMIGDQAEAIIIPRMNHILKYQQGEINILEAVKEYKKMGHLPMHPELQTVLARWLNEHA